MRPRRITTSAISLQNGVGLEITAPLDANAALNAAVIAKQSEILATFRTELEAKAHLQGEWDTIKKETGRDTAKEVAILIRQLHDQCGAARREQVALEQQWSAYQVEFGEKSPQEIVSLMRELIDQTIALQQEITRLRNELAALQSVRDLLVREFGSPEPSKVAAHLRRLRDRVTDLEALPGRFAADLAALQNEFGSSDMEKVVRTSACEMRDTIATLSARMGQYEADRMILERELGMTQGQDIVAHCQRLQLKMDSYTDIAAVLGSMENALKTLDA